MIALLSRGWPVFLAMVAANAVLQAATVAPFATQSPSLPFIALALVSAVSLIAALALVIAQVRASAAGARRVRPRWTDAAASVCVVLAVALAALASSWLVAPTITVSLIVLSGVAAGRGTAGFVAFRRATLRAVVLTLVTLLIVGLLWLGALLLGFFITGWPAAGLTWLAVGAIGIALLCAWTLLARPAVAGMSRG